MIKRPFLAILLCLTIVFLIRPSQSVFAQVDYEITDFSNKITLQEDTSLLVEETIIVDFHVSRHGIYRIIPVTYSYKGKTIRADFKLVKITDESGSPYKYDKSRIGQSVQLKIGDPDITISGEHTYVLTYKVNDVVQRYDTHDEIYWNVTGHEWDTDIITSSVRVNSPFAKIEKVDCFAGSFGSTQRECNSSFSEKEADFSSSTILGDGRDFTIVVALNKESDLVFPGKAENLLDFMFDNWGYLVSIIPFAVVSYFWFKKGRDKKYASDNVYYEPDVKKIIDRPVFAREYLPMVYAPIQGYSPSEIGTVVDEKVDIHDIVAEITELARLGFLKIEKIEKKKLIGKVDDFAFIKLEKDTKGLAEYQTYLLEKLFDEDTTASSIKEIEKVYRGDEKKLKENLKLASEDKYVLLSSLKNNFYKHLDEFKKKLYESLEIERVFDGKPDKVKQKWVGIFIILEMTSVIILFNFVSITANFFPLIFFGLLSIPSVIFAISMPRRTAKGYSLFRQIKGLTFYLGKGKWREEIAEKHLFFGEMLPLAIALGIVDKLVKEMEVLGVAAPQYFGGVATGAIYHDLTRFESSTASTFVSAPGGKWSGSSSWSGGSGFGGGSSGGGFGGGGVGSW
ncbi:hypothetical protein A2865_01540 [Candidatus Woesebacteria bacterium RIFCSPHIGHO2_01_FULL_39_17]|uniref:DUF2207 domain-containing protein n=3 Tax=Candidatus Woeseibacteriota TaxID=1752722 RepID=A0A0G0QT30_9BACT|nr:MAG: hypothetical protein US72_C0014G0029 [Microgenomates group bacterium GW2011_GWC1_38_12]KKQ93578.1 MAG: hypothetical protein UT19_C0010G0022 [Candidatus Woesebacteria bacterium GW2011_GWB1_39_10b]KKR13525.1 MAG: hypothetical protein UT40_C0015G0022 [Candidatus Woesebacteria bacterium GW2011_GWA1_39_21b]OGM22880.1 MAG: hypothetical protein A2865_01540 [Candidatus Woesebacteria bacterium RIFCSPHIGHO2_01_FULL_39_17]OGM61933.1 MAG: hypothetical protein A3A52_00110 [Candidatus Woesebacteria b